MISMIHTPARRLRTTVSLAALACALAASSAAWAQDAAQAPSAASAADQPAKKTDKSGGKDQGTAVAEVVITGTNIKGVKPIAPVQVITREDIDRSGYADIGDVMRSLPEDFAAGQNPGTFNSQGGVNSQNLSDGSTVNLLGLGSDATLTLIDGHRLPGDGFFQGGDISVIPLGAIERIEVVTDGSSAIYGSDAVAGVANFILRKDYNGLEASARYGEATEGGGEQQTYSLLGGVVRDNWHVLASAEFEHEDSITASQRDFTSDAYPGTRLIQPFSNRSVLVSGGVDITNNISFSVDGLYSDRESGGLTAYLPYIYQTEWVTPNYNVAATLDLKLPRDWNLRLVGTEAGSSNAETEQYGPGTLSSTARATYSNDVSSVEMAANGSAVNLPTGDLRLAVGAGYRNEGFGLTYPGEPQDNASVIRASRDVEYVYGEALLPIVPSNVRRLGLQEFDLSVSGRYEHYSDLGDTTNPKVGLRYVPIDGLTIRGTWGTSFKAPSFNQLYQSPIVYYYPISHFGGQGIENSLETYGGNQHLRPEQSNNWSFGADYRPQAIPSMVLSITYFNIKYKDRIVQPVPSADNKVVLSNPAFTPFVTVNPTVAAVNAALASAPADEFRNEVGASYDPSSVGLIVQDDYQNAVSEVDTGVDVSYRQSFALGIGKVNTFASAIWNHLTEQTSVDAPVQTLSGTIYNVPNFRARGGASWSNYGLTVNAIVNYTSGETDTGVTPNQQVASLTTVDANLSYRFPDTSGIRHGVDLSLSATNLFDRSPPFVKSSGVNYPGAYFDSTNASAVGRFVAFQVTKKW